MCSSKSRLQDNCNGDGVISPTRLNKRRVLQPNINHVPLLERPNSLLKKTTAVKVRPPSSTATPPLSPKLKSPRPPAIKRSNDSNVLNSSVEKLILTPKSSNTKASSATVVKKSKKSSGSRQPGDNCSSKCTSRSLIVDAPGSIAAARREHVAIMQEQRKMRIAHYGRTKSIKKAVPYLQHHHHSSLLANNATRDQEKPCTFITPNSDPIYVAYHDEEWGVPVHDDKLLFELLVLIGAQVGSDWTSVLKKRQDLKI
ncbi:dual specificity kinase splA-like [Olea europaea subsp. europaea]|uniref:Dual specificity kinase splA-like n=1 Tax=Olea europaea subsp. europaea TaxID=158383 RepID=A0A8S0PDQ0_OLEEU|nr:dual specificity kinase splA-like [Olea europaea subsp. europaea]